MKQQKKKRISLDGSSAFNVFTYVFMTLAIIYAILLLEPFVENYIKSGEILPRNIVGQSMDPTFIGDGSESIICKAEDSYQAGDVIVFKTTQEQDDGKSIIKRIVGVPGDVVEIIDGYPYINGNPNDFVSHELCRKDLTVDFYVSTSETEHKLVATEVYKDVLTDNRVASGNYLLDQGSSMEDVQNFIQKLHDEQEELGANMGHKPKNAKYVLCDDEYFVLGDNRMFSLDSADFGPIKGSQIIGKVDCIFNIFVPIIRKTLDNSYKYVAE